MFRLQLVHTALIGFAAQAKPVRFENAGASALHTLAFGFNPVDFFSMKYKTIDFNELPKLRFGSTEL